MERKEGVFVILMVLAVSVVLTSNTNLTGNAISYQETSARTDLCRMNDLPNDCLFVERPASNGGVEKEMLTWDDWIAKLLKFGVNCDGYKEGKMTLDKVGDPTSVEIIIGPKPVICEFNGISQSLPAGSEILYDKTTVTVHLPVKISIPKIVSSEIFPSASQAGTENAIRVCFRGADKNSLVNAEIKSSDRKTSTIALYDDGNHGDELKGDGCYGNVLDGLLASGQYSVNYIIST